MSMIFIATAALQINRSSIERRRKQAKKLTLRKGIHMIGVYRMIKNNSSIPEEPAGNDTVLYGTR